MEVSLGMVNRWNRVGLFRGNKPSGTEKEFYSPNSFRKISEKGESPHFSASIE